MTEVLITGGLGIRSSIVSAWVSWIFARKKYNSEVDHNLIENMENSLEFYKNLSDDNKVRLEELTKRNTALEAEIQELRKQMLNLTMNICMDLTCTSRVREQQKFINRHFNGKNKDRFDETEDSSSRRH